MKILILSRSERYYSTIHLKQAAKRLGHSAIVVDPLKCILSLESKQSKVYLSRRELKDIHLVIPRFGVIGLDYALAVLQQFELQGIPVLNSSQAIARVKDKLGCLQILLKYGLPVPRTIMARSARAIPRLLKQLGGTPVILKLLRGSQGVGSILAESPQTVDSILSTVWVLGYDIMMQEFINEARGSDIRILILGGKIIAAMRRSGRSGEFRSNIHRGGHGEKIQLPKSYQVMAQRAAKITRLELAGVDILESKRGPLIIEVNTSPGFEAMEKVTGKDIARQIITYALHLKRHRTRHSPY